MSLFVGILPKYTWQRAIHLSKGVLQSKFSCKYVNTSTIIQQTSKLTSPTKTKPLKKYLKYLGIGCGIGIIGAIGYSYQLYTKVNVPIGNFPSGEEYLLKEPPPKHAIARSIQNSDDRSGLKITLYQFQTCPFCCKVRAYLDYFGFSYDVVEVNSVTHKQTKWTSYRKVPFIVVEQQESQRVLQLKDSSMIVSALQSFICNKGQTLEEIIKAYPTLQYSDEQGKLKTEITNKYSLMYGNHPSGKTYEDIMSERSWRKWVDDVYVHMLSPNVYRTREESFQAFNWFSKVGNWEELFPTWERLLVINVGAVAMYFIGKKLKKRHHLKDDVRQSFYEETNYWLKELKLKGKFMGGNEPDLSDLGMYGVLTAIEGCDAFKDLLSNTKIEKWFYSMEEVVEGHSGSKYLAERGTNKI